MNNGNQPDIKDCGTYDHGSDFSPFESSYWQMLIHREAHTSREDAYECREVEHLFQCWNDRFGTDVKPRWLRDNA